MFKIQWQPSFVTVEQTIVNRLCLLQEEYEQIHFTLLTGRADKEFVSYETLTLATLDLEDQEQNLDIAKQLFEENRNCFSEEEKSFFSWNHKDFTHHIVDVVMFCLYLADITDVQFRHDSQFISDRWVHTLEVRSKHGNFNFPVAYDYKGNDVLVIGIINFLLYIHKNQNRMYYGMHTYTTEMGWYPMWDTPPSKDRDWVMPLTLPIKYPRPTTVLIDRIQ